MGMIVNIRAAVVVESNWSNRSVYGGQLSLVASQLDSLSSAQKQSNDYLFGRFHYLFFLSNIILIKCILIIL